MRSNAIIFDRCNLSAILKDNGLEGFSGTTIAEWICLVFHSSGFDTSALNVGPRATNHGIFLLSAKWWCDDFKTPHARNYCNLSCEALRDDNITDDIQCAKRVVQKSMGFAAWTSWSIHCKGQDLRKYIAGCDLEEVTSSPPVSEKVFTGFTLSTHSPLKPSVTLGEAPNSVPPKIPPEPIASINETSNSTLQAVDPKKYSVPSPNPAFFNNA
ncbi:hypothetical protein NXF25_006257 [Crotalus adamanteus]|uniref:lysozyme n=1 Tax=Crotalus adamanteus TaxID=8729 RepID=A0AAW1BZE7_CROAD